MCVCILCGDEFIGYRNRKGHQKRCNRCLKGMRTCLGCGGRKSRKAKTCINCMPQQAKKSPEAKRISATLRDAIKNALKKRGIQKRKPSFEMLDYTPEQLREHLEKQFDKKMNWDNYGSYWHVDHIVPQARLSYTSTDEVNFQRCWSLENLQPLEALTNLLKSDKLTPKGKALLEKWNDQTKRL